MRKGFDLFLQLWRLLRTTVTTTGKRRGRVCLVWIGGIDPGLKDWLGTEIADAEATGTFRMAGYRDDMDAVFSAADAFALTSREDPFPTVVLEALSAGLPVVAFDRSGGIPDMLRETQQGDVVPYGDVTAMAAAIAAQLTAGITDRAARGPPCIDHRALQLPDLCRPTAGAGDPRVAVRLRRRAELQLRAPPAAAAGQHLLAVPPGA